MTQDRIISLAIKLKKKYGTNNPFHIGNELGFKFDFFPFRKEAVQAYTLKPYPSSSPLIAINSNFDKRSQRTLCAHELCHAIMHEDPCNHYDGNSITNKQEYEANLFAVALLIDITQLSINIKRLDNCILRQILDLNINYN